MKERICGNCAWWDTQDKPVQGLCRYHHPNPFFANTRSIDWCRHWSETTGWDVFEKPVEPEPNQIKDGLLRLAAELFGRDIELLHIQHNTTGIHVEDAHVLGVKERWLEEYKTKC